jgi:uncharacterized protein
MEERWLMRCLGFCLLAFILSACSSTLDESLLQALRSENRNEVIACLEAGANPNAIIEEEAPMRLTPLWFTVTYDDSAMTQLLIQYGANVNLAPEKYTSLVNLAAILNSHRCLPILLKHGDSYKSLLTFNNPLSVAAGNGYDTVVRLLLEAGVSPNIRSIESGVTSLFHSVAGNHSSTTKLLLQHGADCNIVDNEGNTVLHRAAKYCATGVIQDVLKCQIDKSKRNNSGETPADVAGCDSVKSLLQ